MKYKSFCVLIIFLYSLSFKVCAEQVDSKNEFVRADIYLNERELKENMPRFADVGISWLKIADKVFVKATMGDGSFVWIDTLKIVAMIKSQGIANNLPDASRKGEKKSEK